MHGFSPHLGLVSLCHSYAYPKTRGKKPRDLEAGTTKPGVAHHFAWAPGKKRMQDQRLIAEVLGVPVEPPARFLGPGTGR